MDEERKYKPYHEFEQYKIVPWSKGMEISDDENLIYHLGDFHPILYIYRRLDEHTDENMPGDDLFNLFNSDLNIGKIKGLSIGAICPIERKKVIIPKFYTEGQDYDDYEWDEEIEEMQNKAFNEFCMKLVGIKDKLKNLKRLIIGNYYLDDYDHIVINFNNFKEILNNFPNLEFLLLRGNIQIAYTYPIMKHLVLESLIIEGLALNDENLRNLLKIDFPRLSKLVISLGTEHWRNVRKEKNNRNREETPVNMDREIFIPIFAGEVFPDLKYLGLIDSDFTDEIVYELVGSNLLRCLIGLDLSYGSLTDRGCEILINTPEIKNLKVLNLSGHYCSDSLTKNMIKHAKELNINLIMEERGYNQRIEHRYSVSRE